MNNSIFTSLKKPQIYTKSKVEFWNDNYISKQMLKAHLNPDYEGASRKLDFIEKSVSWIKELVPYSTYPSLLDIGCGPGIYAERFALSGYDVTGIDFSKRSIDYARNSALCHQLDITYLYQNYLEMDLKKCFDFSTMIYCDYGALSTENRQVIMSKVYKQLKPGGKFLVDVFSIKKFNEYQERQIWELCSDGGFWRAEEYLALNDYFKYSSNITLDQITIITENDVTPYYLWNTYFTKEMLVEEAERVGFQVLGVFGDVAGSSYGTESDTIAILLEK